MAKNQKEMSKKELLKQLRYWKDNLHLAWMYEDEQAYQQIVKLIEGRVSKEFVENLGHELYDLPRYDMVINRLAKRLKEAGFEVEECSHSRTVCINEEGNAGVFCADCGEQLEKEC